MKIRIVLFVWFSLSLSACQVSSLSLPERYEVAVADALVMPTAKHRSMHRDLFSYYLPLHMGRQDATPTSVQLTSHSQTIVLSLDIINMLNQTYYRDVANPIRTALRRDNASFMFEGYMDRFDEVRVPFMIIASELSDSLVFLQLQTDTFILSSIHPQAISAELLIDMMSIARTVLVQRDLVVTVYSNRDIITYQRENLNIFSQIAPESGTVIDMISDPDSFVFDEDFVDVYDIYTDNSDLIE